MEIKLKGKELPRNEKGDVCFRYLDDVSQVFTAEEITELVNRALYQLEYQAAAHKKRGQRERERMKALKQALKGDRTEIDKQLKGE